MCVRPDKILSAAFVLVAVIVSACGQGNDYVAPRHPG